MGFGQSWPERQPRPKVKKLTIKPSDSGSIASAETWIKKRDWKDWA